MTKLPFPVNTISIPQHGTGDGDMFHSGTGDGDRFYSGTGDGSRFHSDVKDRDILPPGSKEN